MSIPFRQAPFKTAGGLTARALDAWFSDIVNVREFAHLHIGSGVMGSGLGDDSPCIQAAFDAAFKTSGVANGWTNRHLNRPVYIPAGWYTLLSTLTLTKVVGGHIYGAGKHPTQLHFGGTIPGGATLTSILNMNGCADMCIEKLYFEMHNNVAGDNTCVLNIDWDADNSGNGCDGNHGNMFQELSIGSGQYGVIIGSNSASQGHGNTFINCTLGGTTAKCSVGYDARGPNAHTNQLIGGGGGTFSTAFVRCPSGGGQIHAQGMSLAGNDTAMEFIMQSGKVMHISQGRSENANMLKMDNGIVILQSMAGTGGLLGLAQINGGQCIIEGCDGHDAAQITGTGGKLYLAGNYFGTSVTPLSGYSGTKTWNPDGVT
jgi:hypothetical protein